MSTESPKEPVAETRDAEAGSVVSPGAMIREARTRARMSLEELAAATKLARNTLEALERDDFSALLEPVYVRGYYRKCAKIMGLAEKELVEAYQNRVAPKRPDPPAKLRLASGTEIGSGNPLPLPMPIALAVLGAIVGIVLWSFFKSPPAPVSSGSVAAPAAQTELQPATPVGGVLTDIPPPASASAAAVETTTPPAGAPPAPVLAPAPAAPPLSGPHSAPQGTAPAPLAQSAPAAKAEAPAAPSAAPLTLDFTSTSWARVDDAAGKTLLNGLMRDGEKQVLKGTPPFQIFLGNAPGVRVEYNGKAVDFARHVGDNLTARFRVPEGAN